MVAFVTFRVSGGVSSTYTDAYVGPWCVMRCSVGVLCWCSKECVMISGAGFFWVSVFAACSNACPTCIRLFLVSVLGVPATNRIFACKLELSGLGKKSKRM